MVMRTDFEYWELDELDLEPCCALKFYPNIEICNTQIEGDIQVCPSTHNINYLRAAMKKITLITKDKLKEEQEKLAENFGDGKVGEVRSYVWDLMEKPWTSDAAQWYAVFSMMIVLISTITFVFSTLESENDEETHPIVLLAVEIIGLRTRFFFDIRSHSSSA